jgi:hypothetical protein
VRGLAQGIESEISLVIDRAARIAWAALDTFRSIWDSRSPSKVGIDLGVSLPQGIGLGMEQGSSFIDNAMQSVIQPAMMPAQMIGNYNNSSSQTSNYHLSVNSGQDSQGIASDFLIMQAMAG